MFRLSEFLDRPDLETGLIDVFQMSDEVRVELTTGVVPICHGLFDNQACNIIITANGTKQHAFGNKQAPCPAAENQPRRGAQYRGSIVGPLQVIRTQLTNDRLAKLEYRDETLRFDAIR